MFIWVQKFWNPYTLSISHELFGKTLVCRNFNFAPQCTLLPVLFLLNVEVPCFLVIDANLEISGWTCHSQQVEPEEMVLHRSPAALPVAPLNPSASHPVSPGCTSYLPVVTENNSEHNWARSTAWYVRFPFASQLIRSAGDMNRALIPGDYSQVL